MVYFVSFFFLVINNTILPFNLIGIRGLVQLSYYTCTGNWTNRQKDFFKNYLCYS